MDIFVAKLNSETNPDHLKELFSQFGNVVSTKVIMDRETGRSKCYGFVEMDNDADAETAIAQLNDSEFMGNSIAVKESKPAPRNQDRRSDSRRPRVGGGGGRRYDDNNRRFDRGGGDRDRDRGGYGGRDRDRGGYGGDRDRDRGGYNRDRDFNRYD